MEEVEVETDSQNGNTNCGTANVIAHNIAKEMSKYEIDEQVNSKNDGESNELLDNTIGSDPSAEQDLSVPFSGLSVTPVKRSNSVSSVSTDSIGSFNGQAEDSLQFVEYQPPAATVTYPAQQPVPYFLFNGQLYNATAFYPSVGHTMQSYSQFDSNNIQYYQMQPNVTVGYGNVVYSAPYLQDNVSNIPNCTNTGSTDGEINNNTEITTGDGASGKQTQTDIDNTVTQCPESNVQSVQNTESEIQNSPTEDATGINPSYNANNQVNFLVNYPICNNGTLTEQQVPTNYMYTQMNPTFDSLQSTNLNQPVDQETPYMQNNLWQQNNHSQPTNKQHFQYPAIYVSTAGLITVLMKHDVSVETTVEQTLRMVSHQQKLVVAINSRGNATYLCHPAAHIMQDLTTTEADIFLGRKVKMTTANISFANKFNCYKFDYARIDKAKPEFSDLSKDKSVNFLFTETQCNPEILQQCSDIISKAEYEQNAKGGMCIRMNGFKIIQTAKGDVIVSGKGKYMRMSPTTSVLRLDTNFVQMDIEMNWNVRIKRGAHSVNASHLGFVVSNGKVEAAFDDKNKLHAYRLPSRRALLIGGIIGQNQREMGLRND